MGHLFLIALRNLAQHRRRTALLGVAIAGVSALFVALLGLIIGVQQTMLSSATTIMSGHVNVGGFYKVTPGRSLPVVTDYPRVEELVRAQVPELDHVVQRLRGMAKVVGHGGSTQIGISGIDIANEPTFQQLIEVAEGDSNALRLSGTILLFENQAEKLGVKVGDVVTLAAPTLRGVSNTVDARVVAIARDMGMLSTVFAFVHHDLLRKLYQLAPTSTGALHLHLRDPAAVPVVQERLRKVLSDAGYQVMADDPQVFWDKFDKVDREGWTGQKLDVTNWEYEISFIGWVVGALKGLTMLLMVILLLVTSVGIMNAMWVAIRERTREVGTLRAIGMSRRKVVVMFLAEGLLLGLGASAVGVVVGLVVCAVVNALNLPVPLAVQFFVQRETLSLAVDPRAAVGAIALLTLSSTLISLIPSLLAGRLKPIVAIHHMG